jgi:hypothetical protein
MALHGWQSPKQAALYTKKVNRARLEASGAQFPRVRKDDKKTPTFDADNTRWEYEKI